MQTMAQAVSPAVKEEPQPIGLQQQQHHHHQQQPVAVAVVPSPKGQKQEMDWLVGILGELEHEPASMASIEDISSMDVSLDFLEPPAQILGSSSSSTDSD